MLLWVLASFILLWTLGDFDICSLLVLPHDLERMEVLRIATSVLILELKDLSFNMLPRIMH